VFEPTFAAVRKLTKKPILIAETGIGPAAGQAAKLPDLFAGVERTKNLRGFVYFDQYQNRGTYHQNWQIDNDPARAYGRLCRLQQPQVRVRVIIDLPVLVVGPAVLVLVEVHEPAQVLRPLYASEQVG